MYVFLTSFSLILSVTKALDNSFFATVFHGKIFSNHILVTTKGYLFFIHCLFSYIFIYPANLHNAVYLKELRDHVSAQMICAQSLERTQPCLFVHALLLF